MLTLFVIITLTASIVLFAFSCKTADVSNSKNTADNVFAWLIGASFILFLVFLVLGGMLIYYSYTVPTTSKAIEKKIVMYEEKNTEIEDSVQKVIERYMAYEKDTYESFKVEDISIAVSMIPELKTDTLVLEQLNILNENKKKITDLEEQKIDINKKRFLLNFKTE